MSKIRDITVPVNFKLTPLAVKALFRNAPKQPIYEIVNEEWGYIGNYKKLQKTEFLVLLELYFTQPFHVWKNFYSHGNGISTGCAANIVLAPFVMNDLIKKSIKKPSFTIPFLYVYLDDTILAVPDNLRKSIVKIFKEYNPKLHFIVDMQKNKQIQLLDTWWL